MLSLAIAWLSDDKCHAMLCELRWGSAEIVVCPKCQVQNKAYYIASCKQWQCKHCKYHFSVISSTLFSHHNCHYGRFFLPVPFTSMR
ncbi:transposase [Bartonella grahamii]|uniref:transposase n=1 Tax=Bartonella grahamii TaxID=33045 RepID=UPI003AF35971